MIGIAIRKIELKQISLIFFYLFLFFLPLYEAPKNIFGGLFIISGLVFVARDFTLSNRRTQKGPNTLFFWVLLIFTFSPFLAGLGDTVLSQTEKMSNALNWAIMPGICLVLFLLKLNERQVLGSIQILCFSGVIAIAESFLSWEGIYPQLNSVGHVNQSALYAMFLAVGAAILLVQEKPKVFHCFLAVVTLIAVIAYQGPARSLVAFAGLSIILAVATLIYFGNRKDLFYLVVASLCGIVSIAVFAFAPAEKLWIYEDFKVELEDRLRSTSNPYSQRDRLLNSSLEISGSSAFGFGIKSFSKVVTESALKARVLNREGDWEEEKKEFFVSTHGHSLFGNVLVERGWFGVTVLGLGLVVIGFNFLGRGFGGDPMAFLGVLTVGTVLLTGLGQTTLHNEHGQLALLLLMLTDRIVNLNRRSD